MEASRIKIKIGEHEFEAEGPADVVQSQFDIFKQLITSHGAMSTPRQATETQETPQIQRFSSGGPHVTLEKIMHVNGRVISLTALPGSVEDAALLVMLGHKDMRNNVTVTGQEIGDGLAQSGRPVPRVDRVMEKALADAFVLKTGVRRSTRYRLTNQGVSKALGIARELIASVP